MNTDDFRKAMSRFATGVNVVTGLGASGMPVGVTVNAFSSVSLDPPLVLFCLGRDASCFETLAAQNATFVVNILSEEQRALSDLFASKRENKFEDLETETAANGCPLLPGCLASLECTGERVHDGGDHAIIIGRVTHLHIANGPSRPLLYHRSAYAGIGEPL